MICKNCLAKLSPDGSVDYVELCPQHDPVNSELGTVLAIEEEERAERRRYALLQAAATIQVGYMLRCATDPRFDYTLQDCLRDAENHLKQIERREKEPKA